MGIAAPTAAAPSFLFERTELAEWEPKWGDSLLIDTELNMGYLVHSNGEYTRFPVVTGQRRNVSYIGRYYNAKTPSREWIAQSSEIKGDRVTFGPSGRFLRLYIDGERTPYGIHEHRDEEEMFTTLPRFRSMGCIIVQSDILDIIEQTFSINDNMLPVTTQYGIDANLFVLH